MGRLELRDGGAFVGGGNEEPDPLGTLAQLKGNQLMVVLTLSERWNSICMSVVRIKC